MTRIDVDVAADVDNYRRLAKALKRLSGSTDWRRMLQRSSRPILTDVRDDAIGEARSSRHRTLRAVARRHPLGVQANASRLALILRADTPRRAWALGAELGSRRFAQFPPSRPLKPRTGAPESGGYAIVESIIDDYPTIARRYAEAAETTIDAILDSGG